MGNSNLLRNQIIHYYLFHKKLELFFNSRYNPFYNNNSKKLKIEHFYVMSKGLVRTFKRYWNYHLFKDLFDGVNINDCEFDIDKYKSQLEKKFDEINLKLKLEKMPENFVVKGDIENKWFSRNILILENFDNVLDEKSYGYFKKNIEINKKSEIKGAITNDKIILFNKEMYTAKFLYFGDLMESNGSNNYQLIQLTGDFTKISQEGNLDEYRSREVFEAFQDYCLEDINYAFYLFEANNIRIIGEVIIKFKVLVNLFYNKTLSFILNNENFNSRTLEQTYLKIDYKEFDPNLPRLIGLDNVGATCYMNATLQCFINVPTLTNFLLDQKNFQKIIQDSQLFELTSAYCNLLYHVCRDEYVTKSYKPQEFKNVISRKNPLFKGVNANDSKDLINFLLEEMNQELIRLNPDVNFNNNNPLANYQINQTDKYAVLNHFKFDFTKNNNSIIAQNFFFITETKTKCCSCKINKYNYQALYLLEFPLE